MKAESDHDTNDGPSIYGRLTRTETSLCTPNPVLLRMTRYGEYHAPTYTDLINSQRVNSTGSNVMAIHLFHIQLILKFTLSLSIEQYNNRQCTLKYCVAMFEEAHIHTYIQYKPPFCLERG